MLKRAFSITTRCTPRPVVGAAPASSAACSSWVAAFCTVPSGVSALPLRSRITSRSLRAPSGSVLTSWVASSLNE